MSGNSTVRLPPADRAPTAACSSSSRPLKVCWTPGTSTVTCTSGVKKSANTLAFQAWASGPSLGAKDAALAISPRRLRITVFGAGKEGAPAPEPQGEEQTDQDDAD